MLNKSQVADLIISEIYDNTSGLIEPINLRTVLLQMNDSELNLLSDNSKLGLNNWNNGIVYSSGGGVFYGNVIYKAVANQTTLGTFIPSEWKQTSEYFATSAGLGAYLLKDNGIELDNSKYIKTLTTDSSISGVPTGLYKCEQVTASVGLNQQYPISGKGTLFMLRRSSQAESLMMYYPHNNFSSYFVKKVNGNWFEFKSGIQYTASNGIYTVGNDLRLGGDFNIVNLTGNNLASTFNIKANEINLKGGVINLHGTTSIDNLIINNTPFSPILPTTKILGKDLNSNVVYLNPSDLGIGTAGGAIPPASNGITYDGTEYKLGGEFYTSSNNFGSSDSILNFYQNSFSVEHKNSGSQTAIHQFTNTQFNTYVHNSDYSEQGQFHVNKNEFRIYNQSSAGSSAILVNKSDYFNINNVIDFDKYYSMYMQPNSLQFNSSFKSNFLNYIVNDEYINYYAINDLNKTVVNNIVAPAQFKYEGKYYGGTNAIVINPDNFFIEHNDKYVISERRLFDYNNKPSLGFGNVDFIEANKSVLVNNEYDGLIFGNDYQGSRLNFTSLEESGIRLASYSSSGAITENIITPTTYSLSVNDNSLIINQNFIQTILQLPSYQVRSLFGSNGFGVRASNNIYYANLKTDLLTTNRSFQFPNTNGTLATQEYVNNASTSGGSGVIGINSITYNKLQKVSGNKILGNVGGLGNVEEIALTSGLVLSGNTLGLANSGVSAGSYNNLTVNNKGIATSASNKDYITNQIITLSGDITGSGSSGLASTLATVNSNIGRFNNLTVNAKGLVTSASNKDYTTNQTITLSGDITGSGSTGLVTTVGANTITNSKFRQSVGVSIIGRSVNSIGNVADIVASSDGQVLKRVNGVVGFNQIGNNDIANASISYNKIQSISGNKLLGNIAPIGSIEEIALTSGLAFTGNNIQVDATVVPKLAINNTFTGTNQFNTVQLFDTATYRNALLSSSTNLLKVGSGFTSVDLANGMLSVSSSSVALGSTTMILRANMLTGVSASAPINLGGLLSTTLNNPISIGGVYNGATYINSLTSNTVSTPALNLITASNAGSAGSGNINITTGINTGGGVRGNINMNGKVLVSPGTTSEASAALEVVSTSQGLLPPRMSSVQRIAIVAPKGGLIVFDTTMNSMFYYNGSSWTAF